MADLFSRSFHCLLVPSCKLPQKPSERLRISAPIPLPKQRVRVTHHTNMLANSSSPSSSSSNSVPEDYDILSSTACSDGSIVFRFGSATEIREKIAELEQEKVVLEGIEEGGKDGVRALLSEGVEKLNTKVDHNLVEEIHSSSNVVVGVADRSLQLLVNEKESVVLDNDSETAVINDSQEIDRHLMLDSVEDVQHGILGEGVACEGYDVPSVSEEDSEADSHKEAVISTVSEDVAADGSDAPSAFEEDSEADSHKEVVVSAFTDVAAYRNDAPSASEEDSEADSHKGVVVSTVTPESDTFSDLNSVTSGEVEEKEAVKDHVVDRAINNVTGGGVGAGLSEMPVSTSLESEQVANEEDATDHNVAVDRATNNLTGGVDVDVDADFSELMPISTSLESEQEVADDEEQEVADDQETTHHIVVVDRTANSLTGGVDVDSIGLMPASTSLESEQEVADDGETTHHIVEDSNDANKMAKSAMLHEMVPTLDLDNKIDVENNERSDYENPSLPTVPEIHSVETASRGEKTSRTDLFLISAAACLPHPSKALTGREDAYFISDQNWLGVADGIGQWSLEGSNSGLYVKELMEKCENIVKNQENMSAIKPAEVLTRSAAETESPGSSAVLVAHFDGQALHAANVGNTGFIIIRDGSIFKKSTPMFHEFSFPLQIVKGDDPSEIIEGYKIDLNDGDVIITATNGLFDNLYEQEIALIISKSSQASFRPQEIAEFLAMRAQEVGRSSYARSPFGDAAQAAGYVGYSGGKLDHVTVIVSLVKAR